MKKLLFVLIFLLIGVPAHAKSRTWYLYLNNDLTTGVTTVASGTSTMIVEGQGVNRSQGTTMLQDLQFTNSGTWAVQIDDVTLSQGALSAGNWSGATFTLRYKESMYTSANHLSGASVTNVFNGTAISGATRQQQEISPVAMGVMQWEWVTGITPFSGATVMVRCYDEN